MNDSFSLDLLFMEMWSFELSGCWTVAHAITTHPLTHPPPHSLSDEARGSFSYPTIVTPLRTPMAAWFSFSHGICRRMVSVWQGPRSVFGIVCICAVYLATWPRISAFGVGHGERWTAGLLEKEGGEVKSEWRSMVVICHE
jgi:hypothetical protein